MKLLNRGVALFKTLKICSICKKISGTNDDHTDCKEKLRIELEDEEFKRNLPERLDAAKNINDVQPELKALLDHMSKEKSRES